jgi:outer membrane protein assembly factor BamA
MSRSDNISVLAVSTALGIAGTLLLLSAPVRAEPAESLYGKPIREIRISPLKHTKESVVRDALYSKVGDPYLEGNEAQDTTRLELLRIFSAGHFETSEVDGGVVLDVILTETQPWIPLISANLTDNDGFTLGPGVKAGNLFGRAISLSAAARFGKSTTLEVRSEMPWYPGSGAAYRFVGRYRDGYDDLREFQEKSLHLELVVGKQLLNYLGAGIRLGYLSLGSDTEGVTLSGDDRDRTPSLGLIIGYEKIDLKPNPHDGWHLEAEVRQNGGFLGGDGDWLSLVYDIRRYQPIRPRHTLQLASYATFQFGDVGTTIPSYRTFFIGGTNSVRGQEFGSREGQHELLNTFEYRWDVWEPRDITLFKKFAFYAGLQVALLADVGLTWDDGDRIDSDKVIGGIGAGIRILLPYIDVVRFDVAYGDSGGTVSLHVGGYEKVKKQRDYIR